MNELEIILIKKREAQAQKVTMVPDKHYGLLVTLIRTDKPRYWNFLCINCGSKIAEILNVEVTEITDFFDSQNTNNYAIARHCKGVTPGSGLPCPYKYFFHVR